MQVMSIANVALLQGRAALVACRFDGSVTCPSACAVPFEGSQHTTLSGVNHTGNRWNESVTATICTDILLYVPYDDQNVGLAKLCHDVNSLIIHGAVFNSLDCTRILLIKRDKRVVLNPGCSVLPGVSEFDLRSLSRGYMEVEINPEDVVEVLKCKKQEVFALHPLNYLTQLSPVAKQIVISDDPNIAIMGSELYCTAGAESLRVVVRTENGWEAFHIPPNPPGTDLIDTEKSPLDAWEVLISKGKSGLPQAPKAGMPKTTLESSLAGTLKGVSEGSPPSGLPRSSPPGRSAGRGRGGGRGKGGGPIPAASHKNSPYTWGGLWSSVPASQREAYESDLEKAIFSAKQLFTAKVDPEDLTFNGFPIVLLKDAFEHNFDWPGTNGPNSHRYVSTMPSDRRKKIPSMKVSTFLRQMSS
jgi:hypothetical protein